jgi:hypothetical protein
VFGSIDTPSLISNRIPNLFIMSSTSPAFQNHSFHNLRNSFLAHLNTQSVTSPLPLRNSCDISNPGFSIVVPNRYAHHTEKFHALLANSPAIPNLVNARIIALPLFICARSVIVSLILANFTLGLHMIVVGAQYILKYSVALSGLVMIS